MEKKYCIYKHVAPNGKVYIGQTYNTKQRWSRNGNNYKNSPYFYEAIQKYGWENFRHEIILDNLTKKEADEKEKEYIILYDSQNREKGYNCNEGGTGGNQKPTTKVKMYDLQGKFLKSFESAAEAGRYINIDRTRITSCCKKKSKSAGGYRWSYYEEELDWDYINNNARSLNNARSNPIKITDLILKETKIFKSRKEAIDYYNFSKGGFMSCLNNNNPFPKIYLKRYYLEEVDKDE